MSHYIFIDIDGTLLSHTIGIPDSAKEAIDLARKNGHKLFINTGRTKSAVDAIIRSMPFDGYVYAAGAHIEMADSQTFEHVLDDDQITYFINLLTKLDVGFVLEGSLISYYNKKAITYFHQRMERKQNLKPQVVRHLIQENMVVPLEHYENRPTAINKISIFGDNLDQIYKLNEQLDPEQYQFIIYDENNSGEIIVRGINKATGIRKVLELYEGATMDKAVALGDSMNDYDMVKEAGIGIAMGVSHKKLKAVADYITFNVEDGGLFHAFKKFNLI